MKKTTILGFALTFCTLLSLVPVAHVSVQNRLDLEIRASPAWPGLVRTAPITITSTADWITYAASGSGTEGDPFILENFLIECNYSSHGIGVIGTSDFAIIKNGFINESYDDPTYGEAIGFQNSANIIVDNVTIEAGQYHGILSYSCENITIANCTIRDFACTVPGHAISNVDVNNITIQDNTIVNCSNAGIGGTNLLGGGFSDIIIHGNVINDTEDAISFSDGINVTIDSNAIYNGSTHQMIIQNSYNFTISNNTLNRHNNIGVEIQTCQNFTISNNTVTGNIKDEDFYMADCDGANVTDNRFLTRSGFIGSIALADNCTNYIIANNIEDPRPLDCYAGITLGTSIENITIQNNTIYNASNHGAINLNGVNVLIENNTIVGGIAGIYAGHFAVVTNATVRNNTFRDFTTNPAVQFLARDINITITRNYFENVSNYFVNASTGDVQTWERNYYQDYFDLFPVAITTNTTMIELTSDYPVTGTLDDEHPYYLASWFPRSQVVNIRVYSNVDGQGVIFDNLKIYIDSVQIATASPTISHVLFRLTIEDFKGRLLWDQVYNLNDTGTNLNIGVDIAVQIFFHFYSNIDYFGLDFTLVKLYIDGVRYTRFDPIMELKTITITVKDYANDTLYNQVTNLSATGVYLDIGLDIAPVIVKNNFNEEMTFYLAKSGTTIHYTLPGQSAILLRLALGVYSYAIYYTNGTLYQTKSVTFNASSTFSISFGFTNQAFPIPVLPVQETTNYVGAVVVVIVAVCTAGVIAIASKYFPGKQALRRKREH